MCWKTAWERLSGWQKTVRDLCWWLAWWRTESKQNDFILQSEMHKNKSSQFLSNSSNTIRHMSSLMTQKEAAVFSHPIRIHSFDQNPSESPEAPINNFSLWICRRRTQLLPQHTEHTHTDTPTVHCLALLGKWPQATFLGLFMGVDESELAFGETPCWPLSWPAVVLLLVPHDLFIFMLRFSLRKSLWSAPRWYVSFAGSTVIIDRASWRSFWMSWILINSRGPDNH